MPRAPRPTRAPTCSASATRAAARLPGRSCRAAVDAARAAVATPLGIHCHNDCELAVAQLARRGRARAACRCRARSTASASAAATPTSSRSSPMLQLKRGYHVRAAGAARRARATSSRFVVRAREPRARTSARPTSARARSRTRAGCTSPPCRRTPRPTSTSIPTLVGNRQRVLVSDLSGPLEHRSTRRAEFGIDLDERRAGRPARSSDELKDLEARGYAFEGAEASLRAPHAEARSTATSARSSA